MADWARNKVRDLLFGVRMSVRYHRARQSFFESWSRILKFVTALSSSAVVANAIAAGPEVLFLVAGVIVAVAQFADLVVGLEGKAHKHDNLARDFLSLEEKIHERLANNGTTIEDYRRLSGERLNIERSEGATLLWLAVEARNEQLVAQLGPRAKGQIRVPKLQRLLINYLDLFRLDSESESEAAH